ncbi:MAG: PAS domain-containing protein [Alkalispirochaetaceae bacterium]
MKDEKVILLVEDECIIALHEKLLLEGNGYSVHTVSSGEAAVAWVTEGKRVDLVLMDIDLGDGIDGTEAAKRILEVRTLPVVFLTSNADREMVRKVKQISIYGYVLKTSGEFVLLEAITTAFELFNAHTRLQELEGRYRATVEPPPVPCRSLDNGGLPHPLTTSRGEGKLCPDSHGEEHYLKRELYDLVRTEESIFEFLQAGSLDGLWYWDLQNPENEWMSPRFWTLLGYDPDERSHHSSEWQELIAPEDLERATENLTMHLDDPDHPYDQVVRYTHKNGTSVWVRCRGIAIRDSEGKPTRMLGAHNDFTPLMTALNAKDLLLKEFNHRVKNNLAMVDALVQLKQREAGDILDLSDLRHQIDTIRMVHETLQQSDTFSLVDIGPYIERLLKGVFSTAVEPVEQKVRGENLLVSTRKAAPLGLIINELAVNAQKHGFNGEKVRKFSVAISEDKKKDWLQITVSNSGHPIPKGIDMDNPSTLGLRLVCALTSQIGGTMSVLREPSPKFVLSFPRQLDE